MEGTDQDVARLPGYKYESLLCTQNPMTQRHCLSSTVEELSEFGVGTV